ncbi:MAG: hypothetical protein NT104_02935 [Bacteroidetes bacterium]|nr:hypothetical protein [Bacteroidota bacterium]
MSRLFIAFIVLIQFSCSNTNPPSSNTALWEFHPKNNQIAFDNACPPILLNYQELLKGVLAKDTSYIHAAIKNLAMLTDSFPAIVYPKDSGLSNQLKQGWVNINAEIQGLMAESDWLEIYKSTNMISIQLVHLLGEAGFKRQNIYIFTTAFEGQEDGLNWLGMAKTARDPYHPNNKELIQAQQILQEN